MSKGSRQEGDFVEGEIRKFSFVDGSYKIFQMTKPDGNPTWCRGQEKIEGDLVIGRKLRLIGDWKVNLNL
jgi:hypothetical protein